MPAKPSPDCAVWLKVWVWPSSSGRPDQAGHPAGQQHRDQRHPLDVDPAGHRRLLVEAGGLDPEAEPGPAGDEPVRRARPRSPRTGSRRSWPGCRRSSSPGTWPEPLIGLVWMLLPLDWPQLVQQVGTQADRDRVQHDRRDHLADPAGDLEHPGDAGPGRADQHRHQHLGDQVERAAAGQLAADVGRRERGQAVLALDADVEQVHPEADRDRDRGQVVHHRLVDHVDERGRPLGLLEHGGEDVRPGCARPGSGSPRWRAARTCTAPTGAARPEQHRAQRVALAQPVEQAGRRPRSRAAVRSCRTRRGAGARSSPQPSSSAVTVAGSAAPTNRPRKITRIAVRHADQLLQVRRDQQDGQPRRPGAAGRAPRWRPARRRPRRGWAGRRSAAPGRRTAPGRRSASAGCRRTAPAPARRCPASGRRTRTTIRSVSRAGAGPVDQRAAGCWAPSRSARAPGSPTARPPAAGPAGAGPRGCSRCRPAGGPGWRRR